MPRVVHQPGIGEGDLLYVGPDFTGHGVLRALFPKVDTIQDGARLQGYAVPEVLIQPVFKWIQTFELIGEDRYRVSVLVWQDGSAVGRDRWQSHLVTELLFPLSAEGWHNAVTFDLAFNTYYYEQRRTNHRLRAHHPQVRERTL